MNQSLHKINAYVGGEGVLKAKKSAYVIYEWPLVVRRGVVPVYHEVAQIASIQKE